LGQVRRPKRHRNGPSFLPLPPMPFLSWAGVSLSGVSVSAMPDLLIDAFLGL
jgi:hypothetical protein